MKARSKFLCDHSMGMALSAIEIYNKPNFSEREQVFAILMVAAWETLLKAKLLKDGNNKLSVLWVKEGAHYKKKRGTKENLTIKVDKALERCDLSPVVKENINRLIDIRNAAIHMTAESAGLPSLVFALGSASLKNYARLVQEWFGIGLNDYDFFILPLGFSYPFHTFSIADVQKEPDDIARVLNLVAEAQKEGRAVDSGYELVCEIKMTLVSAKKVTLDTEVVMGVTGAADGTIVVQKKVRPNDQYPYGFTQFLAKIRDSIPGAKRQDVTALAKNYFKGNTDYSDYNYRCKKDEETGPQKAVSAVYNENAVRFAIDQLRRKLAI